MKTALLISTVLLALVAAPAHADYIILGTHTDHEIEAGLSLEDVRLSVGLSVNNGLATMTFTNVSVASETAVFKEIVIDGYDDDTHTAILWNAVALTDTEDVSYDVSSHPNGLPGYHTQTSDAVPLIELQAESSPVKYGIGPGEVLHVRFNTSLANGSTIQDYFNAFGGGNDTAAYSIGFHAISAQAVDGDSLSGVAVPEPVTLGMLAIGGLAILGRRAKR
jgi:hypothetical protein